jgi:beta-lactamase regulating signal transducer with metallopeptidase domain
MLAAWLRGFLVPEGPCTAVLDSDIESLARMQRQIGLRRKIGLRPVRSQTGISGLWRPTITLPEGLSSLLAPREFEAVLLHELARAKRRDNLTLALVYALVCLFWFDPLLWWIERRLIAEQELACDELVLRHGPSREEYATAILKVCEFQVTGTIVGGCGVMGSNLRSRMEAIMSFRLQHLNQRIPRFLVGALAAAVTRFLATRARRFAQSASPLATEACALSEASFS